MSFKLLVVAGACLALIAGACGVEGTSESGSLDLGLADADADADAGLSGTVSPVDSIKTSVPSETSSADLMTADSVMQNLAERRGVPLERVVLVSEEQVTWSSGALGCPQPDMSYTQALVPGGRIVLSVDDVNFSYHSGRTGNFFYCENPVSSSQEHPDA